MTIGAFAVSNQSLWIDEANTALKAVQPTPGSWLATMIAEKGSDLQMPLYMFGIWIWEKIFGSAEYALRAFNIPWFTVATAAMLSCVPNNSALRLSMALLIFTNAFIWYYLSEARPYIVLFAFSAILAACLLRLYVDQTSSASPNWFRLFCVGAVGLGATNLIAVPFAIGAMIAAVATVGLPRTREIVWQFRYTTALAAFGLIVLAAYYLWSLRLGARASDIGRTGLGNIAFVVYELTGLSGLGPGRLALREEGLAACRSFLPALALGGLAILTLVSNAVLTALSNINRKKMIAFGLATALPSLLILGMALTAHMRLLGRHFMPLLPFLVAFLALGLDRLLSSRARLSQACGWLIVVLLAASALQMRFAPRHARDDYRSAANLAGVSLEAGEKVWWAADENVGRYYKLALDSPNVLTWQRLSQIDLDTTAAPDLVLLSKRDLYDPAGKIDNYVRRHQFKVTRVLPAFQIFERPPQLR